jgi:uridine kinase
VPDLVNRLYIPFTKNFLEAPSLDPWGSWVAIGGEADAFPYSWPLLAFMVFALFLGEFLFGDILGWIAATLLIDFMITVLMSQLHGSKHSNQRLPIILWALSPTPLIGLGIIGSLDFLPGLFLVLFLLAISRNLFASAGVLMALAISSKLLIAVALFAVIIFATRSSLSNKDAARMLFALFISASLFSAPLLYSTAFRESFAASPAASGPLTWGVGNQELIIFIWPIAVLAVWLATWHLRRFSIDLLLVTVAAPLVLTAAMPGAASGWTIWSLPLLLPLLTRLPKRHVALGFVTLNVSALGFISTGLYDGITGSSNSLFQSAFASLTLGSTIFFVYLAWRELVTKSDFVRLHSRPALILIAGDSGVGKDTLSDGLARALGERSTVKLSGDDYHLWDRGEGAWNFVTHLNPQANNLPAFFDDILKLRSGDEIRVGHYDHRIGRRLSPMAAKSREFIIVSGLHAMWSGEVNSQAQLKVFLEMSDELRVTLKLARDYAERRQSKEAILDSIARRRIDTETHISPQSQSADLVIRIQSLQTNNARLSQEIRFKSTPKLFDNRLVTELISTCELEVINQKLQGDTREIVVRGEADSNSLSAAFERLEPRISRILQIENPWSDGTPGIIQLVTLVYLSNALKLERLV